MLSAESGEMKMQGKKIQIKFRSNNILVSPTKVSVEKVFRSVKQALAPATQYSEPLTPCPPSLQHGILTPLPEVPEKRTANDQSSVAAKKIRGENTLRVLNLALSRQWVSINKI